MLKVLNHLLDLPQVKLTNTAIIKDLKSLDEGMVVNTLIDYLNVLNKIYIIEDLKAWNQFKE